MQGPVLANVRDPIQAAPVALPTNVIRPPTVIKLMEKDTANTTTDTKPGTASVEREEQFADVMMQFKIQLDEKARAVGRVGAEVGVGA